MRNAEAEQFRKWFSRGKQATRNRNAIKLKAYCDWIDKTPEQLKQEYVDARTKGVNEFNEWRRTAQNKIIEFYNYLKEEKLSKKEKHLTINYCRTVPLGILAFYSQNCEKIPDVTKEFDPVQIPENEFVFTQEILRKCYYYGSPFEKTWLSCAVAFGYASQDFLEIETEKIANLVKEAKDKHLDFIGFIGRTRVKTSVQPRSFCTPECISNLSDYLESLKKKHNGALPKYLWNGATNDNLNDWLKALLKKSEIETYGKQVKFHCIGRKFLYDILSKKDETIAKVITGKKTNASDLTYKTSLDAECERIFRECYKDFALNGDVSGKVKREQAEQIEGLENLVVELTKENKNLKTQIEVLTQKLEGLGKMIEERLTWLEIKAKKQEKVKVN